MTDTARLTVGIVSYRTRDRLRECLSALADHHGPVLVVDNDSDDGSAAMVRAEFPSVGLDASDRNLGYGAAANRLVASATTPYLLLLNADARATPGALAALVAKLDARPDVAIVGPRLFDEGGALQRSCRRFPTLGSFFIDQSGLRPMLDALRLGDRHRRFAHDGDREVPWVLGAVMAMRVDEVRHIGGFDDGFFLYFEEVDLSRRLAAAGWRTLFTADAEFGHEGGASSATRPVLATQAFYRSGARYFALHGRRPAVALYRPVAVGALACNWLATLVRRRRNELSLLVTIVGDRHTWRVDGAGR